MARQKKETGKEKAVRILKRVLWVLLCAALLAVAFFVMIIAQPRGDKTADPAATPVVPAAAPPVSAAAEADIPSLTSGFPVPVMSFMSGSGMTFVSGAAEDLSPRGRAVTLRWKTPEGQPLTLTSLCPADADLLGMGDYHFVRVEGPKLAGRASVRMENAGTVRVHTEAGGGLYVLTVPKELAGSLSDLCRSVQLFTAPE